jgi:hypothetical protein
MQNSICLIQVLSNRSFKVFEFGVYVLLIFSNIAEKGLYLIEKIAMVWVVE